MYDLSQEPSRVEVLGLLNDHLRNVFADKQNHTVTIKTSNWSFGLVIDYIRDNFKYLEVPAVDVNDNVIWVTLKQKSVRETAQILKKQWLDPEWKDLLVGLRARTATLSAKARDFDTDIHYIEGRITRINSLLEDKYKISIEELEALDRAFDTSSTNGDEWGDYDNYDCDEMDDD